MRSVVEDTFVLWRKKFSILNDKIRVAPKHAAKVIIACAVLYNMMMTMGCLRSKKLGHRLAIIRNPPDDCTDIRSYLVSCL
ncbi:unnamed protein product [Cylicostephanus goldi]|uniref:DDE Tnp4 domain-containing protein n=1 Tax=Cylicostephanus goldi TaxID=71465 RepID=A0A3P7N6Y7_CYLGO|nr:unnamed protein product [Cylicostephanus goldi]